MHSKSKPKLQKFQNDLILKKSLSSKLLDYSLKSETDKIANKLTLPFGGSCMLAARKKLDKQK